MSSPSKYSSVSSVVNEIVSGCSALHMEPKPIADPKGTYLSDVDHWVEHSLEHFHAAIEMTGMVQSAFSRMLLVMESLIINKFPDEYNWDWDKMTDIERAKEMSDVIAKQIHKK